MSKLCINNYCVSISLEPDYNLKLVDIDSLPYDKFIILYKNKGTKTICLTLEKDNCIKKIAFVIPFYTKIDNCVLASREYLFLKFDNLLCLFEPRTMSVVQQAKISSATGTMFAAYSYKEDFILYGEVEIYRVAPDLSIKWSFSGKDIFVRYHNNEPEPAFKMKKDRICLYDFGDNYYEINYDGILLDSKFVFKE